MTLVNSKKARWNDDGDYFTQMFLLAGNPTEEEIREEYTTERCWHSHDCCGCVNWSPQFIRPLRDGFVALRISGTRNI